MSRRSLPLLSALLPLACSLDGLAGGGGTGGAGGAGGGTTATASSSGGPQGGGGEGGAGGGVPSAFTWLKTIGNDQVQGTSPYATDAGSGSTLRVSEPGPGGEVWLAVATQGAIDPDGAGPFESSGNPDSYNLFVLELDDDGTLLHFVTLAGELENIQDPLSVGAVVRLDGGAIAVAGTFKGGAIDLAPVGVITQPSLSQDDAFVIRISADGAVTHARQLGSGNSQTARAAVLHGSQLLVAGKTKRTLSVMNPSGGATDAACALSSPMDEWERALVAVLDSSDLSCAGIVTFQATDLNATQQAWAITSDASGVYVAGSYNRQIIAPPLPAVPASSNDDGFVVALEADLALPTVRWVARATSNRNGAADGLRAATIAGGMVWVGGYLERGTTAVMSAEPEIGIVDGLPGNDCVLPLAETRDGVVGALDPQTGACSGALLLGGGQQDEVRGLVPFGAGVAATGFATNGVAGLDASLAGGSRDGFVAFLTDEALLDGGLLLGGLSWDYLDAARVRGSGLILAGSYDAPFDVLDGDADFFAGYLPVP